jgi:dihydrofolate reductase
MEIVLYIAVSADGFIADKAGGVSWLDKYNNITEDCGYHDFYVTIDALVFGKNTYEQVLTFGPWPYPGKISYIFGDKNTVAANEWIKVVHTDIPPFVRNCAGSGVKRLWLMGGAQLTQSFDELGLIDEYILTILPDRLGEGIALPERIFHEKNLRLENTITYPISGIVQKYYRNQ